MEPVGVTLGVEEEYHLVDAETFALVGAADRVVPVAKEMLGEQAQGELSTSQLEIATPVCRTLGEVRAELLRLRAGAVAAAQQAGCGIVAAGTHPTASWREQQLNSDPRYLGLFERWGLLALQQLIAGCHVHVAVEDPELVVHVLDRLRPDLPVLLALSTSSPYWEGTDTGYASYRTQWFARWPNTGSTEPFGSRQAYDDTVAGLVAAGIVDDASHLYWDARPSTKFPTLELRVADVMPLLDDVVLHAGLARSLVRVAAAEAVAGVAPVAARPELVRAARWRAARHGTSGALLDLRSGRQVPAAELMAGLLERLREDLDAAGEWDEVRSLCTQLLGRGTSSDAQREVLERSGELTAVTRMLVEQTARG